MRLFRGPPCCVVVVVVAFVAAVAAAVDVAEWMLSSLTVAALPVSCGCELKVSQRLNSGKSMKEKHQGKHQVQLNDGIHSTTRVTNASSYAGAVECYHQNLCSCCWDPQVHLVNYWIHHMKTMRADHGWNKGFGRKEEVTI